MILKDYFHSRESSINQSTSGMVYHSERNRCHSTAERVMISTIVEEEPKFKRMTISEKPDLNLTPDKSKSFDSD